ncbi:hypothetical protein, partial [Burkholderia vietnamiensis]
MLDTNCHLMSPSICWSSSTIRIALGSMLERSPDPMIVRSIGLSDVPIATVKERPLSRGGVKEPGMGGVMAPAEPGVKRGFERFQGCGFLP